MHSCWTSLFWSYIWTQTQIKLIDKTRRSEQESKSICNNVQILVGNRGKLVVTTMKIWRSLCWICTLWMRTPSKIMFIKWLNRRWVGLMGSRYSNMCRWGGRRFRLGLRSIMSFKWLIFLKRFYMRWLSEKKDYFLL